MLSKKNQQSIYSFYFSNLNKPIIILIALFLLLNYQSTFAQTTHSPRLADHAELLSASEQQELTQLLDAVSEKYEQDVVIITTYSLDGKTATEYADDYYDYNNYGFSSSYDGILLLISMEYNDWAISTTGRSIDVFTDAGQEYLVNEFLPDISDADYFAGFKKFINLTDQYFEQAQTGEPYDHGNLPKGLLEWYWLPVALVVSAIIAFIVILYHRNKLKSVKRQNAANDYIKSNSFQLTNQNDLFLYRNVSVQKIPQNQNRSSGSRTHRSSSGRSHGGSSGKF